MMTTKTLDLLLLSAFLLTAGLSVSAQNRTGAGPGNYATYPYWVNMMEDPNANFFEIRKAFYTYWQGRVTHRGDGYKPFKRWEYYWQFRVNSDGSFPPAGQIYREYNRFAAEQPEGSGFKSGNANWLELGPKTRVDLGGYVGVGRLNAIACHPTDTSIVYAGAPSGGLWKSTDGGKNWVVLTDRMPSLGVSSILIHPASTDDILVGTGDRDHGDARGIGVIHSSDGGATWEMYHNGMGDITVGMMARSETDPDFILAATNGGIFKTTDGGAHWELKFAVDAAFKDIKLKPGNSNVAYATSVGIVGFYRSEDAGETWIQVPETAGVPKEGRMVIGVTPAASNLVYLVSGAAAYVGCFVSQDDGKNFILQSDSPNILGYASDGSDDKSQAWYDLSIFVDPLSAQVVHAGGINLWRSDNGGKTWKITGHWTGSGAAEVHADQHTFFYNPVNKRLYAGNDGGIYFTDNRGTTWKEISEGLGIGQIYRLGVSVTNPYKVVTGFQDNGSATWTGKEWLTSGGGDGMESAVDPTDYQYSYTTIYYGDIYQYLFNGYNRQVGGKGTGGIDEDGAWVTPFLIHQDDGNTMIAGYKNIWITRDLKNPTAISWKKISNNLAGTNDVYVAALEQSPAQPQMLYVSRFDRRLFRTDDFNKPTPVWIDLTSNLPIEATPSDLECHPFDPMTIYMTLARRVFKSSDKGETWTDISGSLPNIAINTILFDESSVEGLYVGTDAGVYFIDAGMPDWVFYNTNLPLSVEASELEVYYDHLDRSKSRLRASTFGRGLWESPLAQSDPILPATFLAAVNGKDKITLYWNTPFYPQYVSNYKIFRNNILYDVSTTPSWSDDQVEYHTDYTYYIVAVYANSTEAKPSNSVSAILIDPVTLPYSVDFEPGTAGWTSTKTVYGWKYGTASELGIPGNYGHFFGIQSVETTANNKVTDCLISPATDLSSYKGSAVTLSFDYSYLRTPEYGKLNVVYRVSKDSTWAQLLSLNPANANEWDWDSVNLILPDQALTATTRIGFLYENHGNSIGGAGIDNIQLTAKSMGIRENSSLISCRIFPNPNNGLFQIEVTPKQPGKISIQVVNLNGQVVLNEQLNSGTGQLIKSFDLRNQARGVYQIRIQTSDGNWTDRITIQ
ncbi:MAG: T9SS type A sorting domain-containing protein [Bacteroidales bacterium]